jgi:hypothetical protein
VGESFIPVENKKQNYVLYILNLMSLGSKYEEILNRIAAGNPLFIVCNVHLKSEIYYQVLNLFKSDLCECNGD